MSSDSSFDSTDTTMSSDSSSVTSKANTIEVPSFYHQQWPVYPRFFRFRYDGTTFYIRLRKHRTRAAEGHASSQESIFGHFKLLLIYDIVFSTLQRLPNCAMTHVNDCGQHMTILRRFGPLLQWNVVVFDIGISQRYVVPPWYQFLTDSDFSHGDEVSFYYRSNDKIWEIVIRHNKNWDY
ncbi:hypothetical protein GmHk_U059502 [Glycine max]|nr:hypothetical protein GmHk_U059502 [Glycine max]